jgi:DNA-binding LacI/PurR family transcriptional regulator
MPRRVTLRDIAKSAGFSPATVSSALNNDPRVRASTRELIKATAEKLGYRPDPALLALSAHRWDGQRNPVGMTISYVTGLRDETAGSGRYVAMIEAMRRRTESLGYRFYTHHLDEFGSVESANRILTSRGTAGLLVGPLAEASQVEGFDWNSFSAVAVDLGHHRPPLRLITNNPLTCVQIAWHRVLEAGRRRIGVILAPDSRSDFFNEQRAWVLRLQHELPRGAPRIPMLDWTGADALSRWIKRHRPDVIIGYNEWLVRELRSLGHKVPQDIAFVTLRKDFKEYPTVPLRPEIAGMVPHPEHLGQVAVDQVDLLIRRNEKGPSPFNLTIYIDLSWHPGASLVEGAEAD